MENGDKNRDDFHCMEMSLVMSRANLPFVEIGRRGNVRADSDLNKRRIYIHSFIYFLPLTRNTTIVYRNTLKIIYVQYAN